MFVQHMLAVAADRRHGGDRHAARRAVPGRRRSGRSARGFIEDDLLEAVIGLPPNLFYGTGIPACILVLRRQGREARRAPGQGAVHQRRRRVPRRPRQNYLRPEHVEKIVSTFQAVRGGARLRGGRRRIADSRTTTTTATSAATPTTPRRPSRRTSAPTSSAACRGRKLKAARDSSRHTESTTPCSLSTGTRVTSISIRDSKDARSYAGGSRPAKASRSRREGSTSDSPSGGPRSCRHFGGSPPAGT